MEEYKAVLAEASSANKTFLETGHLHSGNELFSRTKWFQERSDRCSREDLAA